MPDRPVCITQLGQFNLTHKRKSNPNFAIYKGSSTVTSQFQYLY
jgi:hypothetical protein